MWPLAGKWLRGHRRSRSWTEAEDMSPPTRAGGMEESRHGFSFVSEEGSKDSSALEEGQGRGVRFQE